MFDGCCDDCAGLKAQRYKTLEQLADVEASIQLRSGSADCDVNPINVYGPAYQEAMRALNLARNAIGKYFDTLGATEV